MLSASARLTYSSGVTRVNCRPQVEPGVSERGVRRARYLKYANVQ